MSTLLDELQRTVQTPIRFNEEAILASIEKENGRQSLPVKILSIFGGILASITFLAFLLTTGLYDTAIGLSVSGITISALAILLSRHYDQIIWDTISITAYIIGVFLIVIGCSQWNINETVISMICIVMAATSLRLAKNYIMALIPVLMIDGAVLTIIFTNNIPNLIHLHVSALALTLTYLILNEARLIARRNSLSLLYKPIRTGILISFLSGLAILGNKMLLTISPAYIWISAAVMIFIIVYLLSLLMTTLNITVRRTKIVIYALSIASLCTTALSPAITGALLILLLSVGANYKTGIAAGIVSFIYFVAQYYYDMSLTLLTKSILLMATGLLFLSLYLLIRKKDTSHEEI